MKIKRLNKNQFKIFLLISLVPKLNKTKQNIQTIRINSKNQKSNIRLIKNNYLIQKKTTTKKCKRLKNKNRRYK